jgi:acyl-CoA hydrolase
MAAIRRAKTPSESETIATEVVFPNDTNPMGMLQGGRLMQWMDMVSAVCAQTHAERIAVTVSINKVFFKNPAKTGDIITIKARITRAFSTSMEIFVQAWARKVTSREAYLINEAFFTFVALDDNAKPAAVPPVKPVTAEEKLLYRQALERNNVRLNKTANDHI